MKILITLGIASVCFACPVWAQDNQPVDPLETIQVIEPEFSFLFTERTGPYFSEIDQKANELKKQTLIENIRQLYTSDFL